MRCAFSEGRLPRNESGRSENAPRLVLKKERSLAPKRVLVVSESLSRGGLETRLSTQAQALRERGYQVGFACAAEALACLTTDLKVDVI